MVCRTKPIANRCENPVVSLVMVPRSQAEDFMSGGKEGRGLERILGLFASLS